MGGENLTLAYSPERNGVKFFSFLKKKQMQYEIVFCKSQFELVKNVEKFIAQGWKPIGGPGCTKVKLAGNAYDHTIEEEWFQAIMRKVNAQKH